MAGWCCRSAAACVLVDLTKQVSSEAIKVLEEVLAELKRRRSVCYGL